MKLFTKSIDEQLFKQYKNYPEDGDLSKQKVITKIFNPYGSGSWYILNSDENDPDYLWAIVDLVDVEVGSVSRMELETLKVPPFRLGLERDTSFTPMNAKEVYDGLKRGKRFKEGGEVETEGGQNKEMLENQANEIDHHIKELKEVMKQSKEIEPWVIAKAERSATDLADITHYIDGEGKKRYAEGGEMKSMDDFYKEMEMRNLRVKSKVASIIGIDQALKYLDMDFIISPFKLIQSAVAKGFVTIDEIDENLWSAALRESEDIESYYRDSGQGIGSSDMNAFVSSMLKDAGIKIEVVDNQYKRMEHGGMSDKLLEKYKGYDIVESRGVIEVVKGDSRFIIGLDDSKMSGSRASVEMAREQELKTARNYIDWVTRDKMAKGGMLANGKDAFAKGDEGMYEGDEVRVVEYNSKEGKYLYDILDEDGNQKSKGSVKKEKFENQFRYFPKMASGGEFGVDKFRTYFSTFGEVMDAINDIAADNGYNIVDIFPDLSYGGISYGETKRAKVELEWDSKIQEKRGKSKKREKNTLNVQIYRMPSGNYELNSYFSYKEGGYMAKGGKAESEEVLYIEYLNAKKKFAKDKKEFKGEDAYKEAISWGRKNIPNFNADMVKFKMAEGGMMADGGKVNERYKVTVYYGGEGNDEIFYVEDILEAREKAAMGEHSEIYDTMNDEYVMASGGMMAEGGEIMKHKYYPNIKIELIEPTNKGWKVKQIETHSISGKKLSKPKEKIEYFSKAEINELFEKEMAMGGKVKFADKVAAVKKSLLERKKVPKAVQKDYGKTFSPAEAEDSAKRIVGAQTARERLMARIKSKKKK